MPELMDRRLLNIIGTDFVEDYFFFCLLKITFFCLLKINFFFGML